MPLSDSFPLSLTLSLTLSLSRNQLAIDKQQTAFYAFFPTLPFDLLFTRCSHKFIIYCIPPKSVHKYYGSSFPHHFFQCLRNTWFLEFDFWTQFVGFNFWTQFVGFNFWTQFVGFNFWTQFRFHLYILSHASKAQSSVQA